MNPPVCCKDYATRSFYYHHTDLHFIQKLGILRHVAHEISRLGIGGLGISLRPSIYMMTPLYEEKFSSDSLI